MPPTPDDYVRDNMEPTLTKGLGELCRARPANPCTWLAEWLQANKPPPPKRAAPEPKPEPLSAEALAAATARYSTTADLRKLLTYDEERGGIPIRLLSARWLLTHFTAEGNETARLEHRQWLEREHPEAFVSGEALERVLAELEGRTVKWKWSDGREKEEHGNFYMSKVKSGEWRTVTQEKFGSDEQAYSRSFQIHMARTMVTSFQLEIAILEGDSDKAKELVKAMVIERNSGHDLFEN